MSLTEGFGFVKCFSLGTRGNFPGARSQEAEVSCVFFALGKVRGVMRAGGEFMDFVAWTGCGGRC